MNALVVIGLLLAAATWANNGSVRAQDEIIYAGDGLSLPEEQTGGDTSPEINHPPGEGPALSAEPQAMSNFAPDGTPLDALPAAPESIALPEVAPGQAGMLGADPDAGASGVLPNSSGIPIAAVNFVALSTNTNISLFATYLNSPALNQLPTRSFLATVVLDALGTGTVYHNHPLGAYYSSTAAQWTVFNEDAVAMPAGVAFSIFTPPQNSVFFTHTATVVNTSNNLTLLDNAYLNSNPDAKVFAMPANNPGSGSYFNHNIGVYYQTESGRWGIFNQVKTEAILAGSSFFVYVSQPAFTQTVTHITTKDNSPSNYTVLDSPLLNNNPNVVLNVMHEYGTGVSAQYSNAVYGVWYSTRRHKWTIYRNDSTAMATGLKFNVLIQPKLSDTFVFMANASNIMTGINDNVAVIDHPLLNYNPNALVYVMHNLNPPGAVIQNVDNHPLGVRYVNNHWAVYQTDFEAIPVNSYYNIYVTNPQANAFSAEVTAQNSVGPTLHLNHPQLNDHPGAVFIENENLNPGELITGRTYGNPTYAAYNSGIWNILRVGGPDFDLSVPTLTTAFNVLIPRTNAFMHVATVANRPNSSETCIDNSLTNNRPGVVVFAYVNGTPSGVVGVYYGSPIGVVYHTTWNKWCIYSEGNTTLTVGTTFNVFIGDTKMFLPLISR